MEDGTRELVRGIAAEHANERGAALAYRGHARNVRHPAVREAIARIEAEEWHHRAQLSEMLTHLGGRQRWLREGLMACIGTLIGLSCAVTPRWVPLLGAGLIERGNIGVYVRLVQRARAADRPDLAERLAVLGQVEVDHAVYFFERVAHHPIGAWFAWLQPTERERRAFMPTDARSDALSEGQQRDDPPVSA